MTSCATLAFAVFTAICEGWITFKTNLAALCVLSLCSAIGGAGVNGLIPPLLELSLEATYVFVVYLEISAHPLLVVVDIQQRAVSSQA